MIEYKAKQEGIQVIVLEESYTSKASFPDQDNIPLFRGHDASLKFSGKRSSTVYKGQHRSKGFRGIYVTKDGTAINADLNGSANIGRKAFPELFPVGSVCFDNPTIYKHPDCIRQFGSAS